MQFLKGKKTYLVCAIAIALNFAVYMSWLTVDQLGTINVILGGFGLAAIRSTLNT